MTTPFEINVSQNGDNWYWEVVSLDGRVVGRGLAETNAKAQEAATAIAMELNRQAKSQPGIPA